MHAALIAAKAVTMVLGLVIALHALRGYRLHGSEPMLFVAVGFALVSVGAVAESLLFDLAGLTLSQAATIQTGVVGIGMALVAYSLYGELDLGTAPRAP